jgi:hypothetical protein
VVALVSFIYFSIVHQFNCLEEAIERVHQFNCLEEAMESRFGGVCGTNCLWWWDLTLGEAIKAISRIERGNKPTNELFTKFYHLVGSV